MFSLFRKKIQQLYTQHNNQKGALFGLDARISLVIFSGLTVIVGATLSSKISSITGGALIDELNATGQAIEGMQLDLKADIFKSIDNPNEENAFMALYDKDMLNTPLTRSRWLGPYIKNHTNIHPAYGKMSIVKRTESYKAICRSGDVCYLWITLEKVPYNVIEHTDKNYDGKNPISPETDGRIQWEFTSDDFAKLWYRVGRSA